MLLNKCNIVEMFLLSLYINKCKHNFRNTYAYIIILGKSILLSNKHIYNNIIIYIHI